MPLKVMGFQAQKMTAPPRNSRKAFTLVELLSVIAIIAVLVTAASFFTASYIQWAKQVNDQRTFTVLNDALTRYKGEGGSVNALTYGAPVGHILTAMQTAVTWGGISHQFLNAGFTYPSRSLQAMGTGAQYQFYQVGVYSAATPAFGTPTNQYPYGNGVGYMANSSAQAYAINIASSSGYYAVQLSSGGSPTCYTSGTHSVGTSSSITFWACISGSNSTPSGTITYIDCRNQQLTSLNIAGLSALQSLFAGNNPIASLDVSGHTALTTLGWPTTNLSSLNMAGCTGLTGNFQLDYPNHLSTQLASINVTGCSGITTLNLGGNNLTTINVSGCTALQILQLSNNSITNLDVSGHTALTILSWPNTLTSLNISGCTGLSGSQSLVNGSLVTLNASGCTGITSLNCHDNSITSLNVSGCTALTTLNCYNNQLGTLNITHCYAISTLNDYGNPSLNIVGP